MMAIKNLWYLWVSTETQDLIEKMCAENQLTRDDLFRRALALIEFALDYKKKGGHLVVVDDNNQKISEIVGL